MRTNGHTIVICTQHQPLGDCLITLECTCGQVFSRGLFPVNDVNNRLTIFDEGKPSAREHLAQTLVAAQS